MDNVNNETSLCPVCCNFYPLKEIEYHVNKCLFLNSKENESSPSTSTKRGRGTGSVDESMPNKRTRVEEAGMILPDVGRIPLNGGSDVLEVTCHCYLVSYRQ